MSSGMLYAGALRANLVERAELWRWSSLGSERSKIEEAAFPILSDWPLPRPADWLEIVNQSQPRSGTGGVTVHTLGSNEGAGWLARWAWTAAVR